MVNSLGHVGQVLDECVSPGDSESPHHQGLLYRLFVVKHLLTAGCHATSSRCCIANITNISAVLMTSHLLVKNCDGGHICHPPKECCKQGCCYPDNMSVYRPPPLNNSNIFPPLFVGHWYFWAAITATLAGILCACSLWRRNSSSNSTAASTTSTSGFGSFFCCSDGGGGRGLGDEGISEPDSNGSCYAPPQYSRCSSFHQAPPPYTEVTSKPDLYPLVIGYNNRDTVLKTNGPSTGYLMVQYFRNFIVRPVGSLSATSTIDSLSSSFICNAANEANTIIPPTYSCMGSLEEVRTTATASATASGASPASTMSTAATFHELPAVNCTNLTTAPAPSSSSNCVSASPSVHSLHSTISHKSSNKSPTTVIEHQSIVARVEQPSSAECNSGESSLTNTLNKTTRKLNLTRIANRSVDSDEDHNFSDLLNLSICLPTHGGVSTSASGAVHSIGVSGRSASDQHGPQDLVHMQNSYSVTNSMTSSDISSLANLGTPDSPPRATSPTLEMKELLDKIQQLPQQRSPVPVEVVASSSSGLPSASTSTTLHQITNWSTGVTQAGKVRAYFHRSKAKTMYMPLYEGPTPDPPDVRNSMVITTATTTVKGSGALCQVFGNSGRQAKGSGWLSRSAPNTPCGTFAPTFPSIYQHHGATKQRQNSSTSQPSGSNSRKGSKSQLSDGSPLLNNAEDEEDDEDESCQEVMEEQKRKSTNADKNL